MAIQTQDQNTQAQDTNPQFNGVINASQLTSPNFQFKAPTLPDNTQLYQSSLNGLSSLAQSNITADEAFQASQDKAQQLSQDASSIEQLRNAISGKEAYSQQQAQALGVNDARSKLTDVNKQILALNAQVQNIPDIGQLESKGRNVTEASQQIIDTDRLRQASIQGNILMAQQAAANLDLETARQKVTDAVNLKYKDQEDLLKAKEQSFDLNQKLYQSLSANQKDAWDRAKYANEQAQKKLDEKKKDEEAIQNMLVEATPNAPASVIANAKKIVEQGGSKLAVAQALGIYGGDYLATQIKKAQLAKLGLENKKAYDELYSNAENGTLKSLSYEDNAKFNSTPEAKGIKDATSYAKAVADYKAAIEKYGTGELLGEGSGALGQAYSALVGATKDYYTLGTLDNGVQKLIALGIPEPSVLGLKKGRIDALDTALDAASNTIKRNSDQLLSTKYKNTNELKQLMDNANGVLMYRMSNQDFLSQIPGSSPSGTSNTTDNTNFFNK